MLELNVQADLAGLQRDLTLLEQREIPFATALALTSVAYDVRDAEVDALDEVFDRPTPFTKRSVSVRPATKRKWTATVFVKDIAAEYLAPYEFGGQRHLGNKQAILKPVDYRLNKYGNLPRSVMARLKGRPNVYVGGVQTRSGVIHGVWEKVDLNTKGKRRRKGGKARVHDAQQGRLKLLIRFDDPQPVRQKWGYFDRARATIPRAMGPAWTRALSRATGVE